MQRFLFMFGYNTPEQIQAFEKYDYDDEDTEGFSLRRHRRTRPSHGVARLLKSSFADFTVAEG